MIACIKPRQFFKEGISYKRRFQMSSYFVVMSFSDSHSGLMICIRQDCFTLEMSFSNTQKTTSNLVTDTLVNVRYVNNETLCLVNTF